MNKHYQNNLPSINQLMIENGKSREAILQELGLIQPPVKLIVFMRNTKEEIKEAKILYKSEQRYNK